MNASNAKTLGLLLLGCLPILFLASFAYEPSQMANSLIPGPSLSTPTDPPKEALSSLAPHEMIGAFRPLTEEYLRRKEEPVPYDVPEIVPEPMKVTVFQPISPLELALLPNEKGLSRKRRGPHILLSDLERVDGWRPLSKEARVKRERVLAQRAVEMGAELADSLYMPYFSSSLLWTTRRFNAYRYHLAEQYHLHIKLSEDDATLTYNLKY